MSLQLWEAVRLGSLLIERPAAYRTKTCAIGMALLAHGVIPDGSHDDYQRFLELYPWLDVPYGLKCPCCGDQVSSAGHLAHVFDSHVMRMELTMERFCDWLAGIEERLPDAFWESFNWDLAEKRFVDLTGLGTIRMATPEELRDRYALAEDIVLEGEEESVIPRFREQTVGEIECVSGGAVAVLPEAVEPHAAHGLQILAEKSAAVGVELAIV